MPGLKQNRRPGNLASLGKRSIVNHVCTPCENDETNFCFPQQIMAETIRKRR